MDLVVDGADVLGHFLGRGEVGGADQAHGERMDLGPPGRRRTALLHPALTILGGDGGEIVLPIAAQKNRDMALGQARHDGVAKLAFEILHAVDFARAAYVG